jgi:DNA replication and repair protein RecF
MYLQELKLTNFRSHAQTNLAFSPRINALVGLNGVGKTNVLDAIHYLCLCKSNFAANDRAALRKGQDFFRLEGLFYNAAEDYGVDNRPPFRLQTITCTYATIPRAKKQVLADGVAYEALSQHVGRYPLIFIAPDDTRLLTEGSSERRQFLDFTLSQLDSQYLRQLIQYNKILEQRNALLRQGQTGAQIDSLLMVYAAQLSALIAPIYLRRKAMSIALIDEFQSYYTQIATSENEDNLAKNNDIETVNIDYQSLVAGANSEETEAIRLYSLRIFTENLRRDQQAQRTSYGTHHDDLICTISEQPVKQAASQGQRKSYLLALKLAQYSLFRRQNPKRLPLLLLDDIFDKLDGQRVERLLRIVSSRQFGQVFISDTNAERLQTLFDKLKLAYTIWEISPSGAEKI